MYLLNKNQKLSLNQYQDHVGMKVLKSTQYQDQVGINFLKIIWYMDQACVFKRQ